MKFKAQEKQNLLIENITVHHLVVGACRPLLAELSSLALLARH
ncbi:hypothetical protein ACWGPW_29335 [Paenibacillus chitinolyticus]